MFCNCIEGIPYYKYTTYFPMSKISPLKNFIEFFKNISYYLNFRTNYILCDLGEIKIDYLNYKKFYKMQKVLNRRFSRIVLASIYFIFSKINRPYKKQLIDFFSFNENKAFSTHFKYYNVNVYFAKKGSKRRKETKNFSLIFGLAKERVFVNCFDFDKVVNNGEGTVQWCLKK